MNVTITIPTIQIQAVVEATSTGGGGGNSTVENSDQSYQEEIICGDTLVLPDIEYNIFVNSVLNQSFSWPALKDLIINIGNG